jgi:hypothetical protein
MEKKSKTANKEPFSTSAKKAIPERRKWAGRPLTREDISSWTSRGSELNPLQKNKSPQPERNQKLATELSFSHYRLISTEAMIALIPRFCDSAAFEQACRRKMDETQATLFERVKAGVEVVQSDIDSIYDAVLAAFDSTALEVLSLSFGTIGDWGPMVPDDILIKELGGNYYISWSDFKGPFMSLKDALDTEFFNVPTPNAGLTSKVLTHEQVLKIAYAIADWSNEEEGIINDIRVNDKRYRLANHKLILIKESETYDAPRTDSEDSES